MKVCQEDSSSCFLIWHHPGRNEILLDIGDQTDPHNTPLLRTTHLI